MLTLLSSALTINIIVPCFLKHEESQKPDKCNKSMKTGKDMDDDSISKAGLCQICYGKKIECIFLPCGHARTCEDCAIRIKNSGQPCPYCRKSVSTTHRIYL